MRRSGHPSRPRAITCCFFASLKTLLISTKAKCLTPKSTSRASFSLAGFQVTLIGRFWVTPEVNREEGRVECLGQDGKVLASVLIHHCGPACDEDALADAASIEEVTCVRSSGSSLRAFPDQ